MSCDTARTACVGCGVSVEIITGQFDSSVVRTNYVFGSCQEFSDSRIEFRGCNNVLYLEDGVRLHNSTIVFHGSNSLVVIGKSRHVYRLNVAIYHDSVFSIGRDCYFNGVLNAIVSERCHIIIGSDCLISFGVWMRTADPHLVYDVKSGKRINPSKSIVLGDHVWLGQSCLILKGSVMGSGSILGGAAVLAGKVVPSNTSWAGNPARAVRSNVMWDGGCVHAYDERHSKAAEICNSTDYVFRGGAPYERSGIRDLLSRLHETGDAKERCEIMKKSLFREEHDQFAISQESSSRESNGNGSFVCRIVSKFSK